MKSLLRPREAGALVQGALAVQLTAVVLLQLSSAIWYVKPAVIGLAALALLFPRALRTPLVWAVLSLLSAVAVARMWPVPDNHDYLLVYWTLAVFLALLTARPDRSLAVSARWLVAAVFVWATLWKAFLSPDFMDERFYRVTLLTDYRFAAPVSMLGGLDRREMSENRVYLARPTAGDREVVDAGLHEPAVISGMATFLTWATVLFEGVVALAFLFSWGRWTALARHGLLLLFCATTYALAPVPGFGWLLAIMGLAQVPADRRVLRAAYVGVCFLILLYAEVPWGRILYELGVGRY